MPNHNEKCMAPREGRQKAEERERGGGLAASFQTDVTGGIDRTRALFFTTWLSHKQGGIRMTGTMAHFATYVQLRTDSLTGSQRTHRTFSYNISAKSERKSARVLVVRDPTPLGCLCGSVMGLVAASGVASRTGFV